jgi:fructose-bisphosphate aldolase class II
LKRSARKTDDKDFRKAIAAGINIIHINAELRVARRRSLEDTLARDPNEVAPYRILPSVADSVEHVVSSRLRVFYVSEQSAFPSLSAGGGNANS